MEYDITELNNLVEPPVTVQAQIANPSNLQFNLVLVYVVSRTNK